MDYNGMCFLFSSQKERNAGSVPPVSLTVEMGTPKIAPITPQKVTPATASSATETVQKKTKPKRKKKKKAKKARLEVQEIHPNAEVCNQNGNMSQPLPKPLLMLPDNCQKTDQSNVIPLPSKIENPKTEAIYCSSLPLENHKTEADFRVEVAPENYPSQVIDKELKVRLSKAIIMNFECMSNGQYPTFRGISLDEGAYVITCAGEATKNWLLNKLPTLQWDGPKLKAGGGGDIIKKHVVCCEPPKDLSDFSSKDIMNLLLNQNPTFRCGFWKYFASKKEHNKVMHFWLVGEKVHEAVRSVQNQAYLGLSKTKLSFIHGHSLESLCASVSEIQPSKLETLCPMPETQPGKTLESLCPIPEIQPEKTLETLCDNIPLNLPDVPTTI